MPTIRYMQDRASRRNMMRDGRNPYGSKGGYVSSRKSMRGRDRAMDYNYDYPERDSRYVDRHYGKPTHQERYMGSQQYREYNRPMDYEMYGYGIGSIRPMINDYGMYPDYSSEDMDHEWKQDLHEWTEKLKKHDRFNVPKEQLIHNARQMGVKFDSYSEDEFLTTYYMVMSDFPQIANEPHTYLALAKDWLHDTDSKLQGADKLCAYYYEVINAGEE